jgi:predicted transcriptional regulator
MEVHFSPDVQAKLTDRAAQQGCGPDEFVRDVVARYLDEQERFLAAVEKGIAAAARGELIEEEEMDARIEHMFPKP